MGWVVVVMVVGAGGGGQVVLALSLQFQHFGLGRAAGWPPPCSTSATGKHSIDTAPFNPAGGQQGLEKGRGMWVKPSSPTWLGVSICVCFSFFFCRNLTLWN